MNGPAAWTILGVLAVELALLVAVAALVARRVSSPVWQRTIWQGCFVALLGLLTLEATGGARALALFAARDLGGKARNPVPAAANVEDRSAAAAGSPAAHEIGLEPGPHVYSQPPYEPERRAPARRADGTPIRAGRGLGAPGSEPSPAAMVEGIHSEKFLSAPVLRERRGFGLLRAVVFAWVLGAMALLALNALARLRFAVLLGRSHEITDPARVRRVQELAEALGMTRRIRLFESARLRGPVACGILRPAIGLPPRFDQAHTADEKDAMIAHEAGHLAASDPAWHLLADVLSALLWWHPSVWWARRRLHAAGELAADEASLLVHDGPVVLAASLVVLGADLNRPRPAHWLGIEGAGFRSGLARRVERLLKLSGRNWSPPRRARAALARTLAPVALVTAVILCTAWTVPEPSTPGENMKHPYWKRSLGLLALVSALTAAEDPAIAADAQKVDLAKARSSELSPPPDVELTRAKPRAAADLQARLESIVIDEITYDNLPLGEVIKSLMRDAAARDPEKVGVNFLFGRPSEPIRPIATAIDPATGLPVAGSEASEIPVFNTTIRITPALKKVRLIDALDAIVRVADQPIKYTIESYAVVLTLDGERINAMPIGVFAPPPAPVRQTRAFKVDTNIFFLSVQKMFGPGLDPANGAETGAVLRRTIFPLLGVKLGDECLVLYNPLTGMLLVRAPQNDFATLQAAIEALGGSTVASMEAAANSRGGILGSSKNLPGAGDGVPAARR